MGFVDWIKSLLSGNKKTPRAEAAFTPVEGTPSGLRRTIFVRSLDMERIAKRIREYGEMAREVWGLPEGVFEVLMYGPNQGWIAIALPMTFPPFHFLNLVSWMTDAVGSDKDTSFAGSVGFSVAEGALPQWNCAFRTDPRFDGSVVTGVLADGHWFSTDLTTGSPMATAQPMFEIDRDSPLDDFMERSGVPKRMTKDPGYWTYLSVARREVLA